jgi:hypothetical protein
MEIASPTRSRHDIDDVQDRRMGDNFASHQDSAWLALALFIGHLLEHQKFR